MQKWMKEPQILNLTTDWHSSWTGGVLYAYTNDASPRVVHDLPQRRGQIIPQ